MAQNLRDRPDIIRAFLEASDEEDSESLFGDNTDSDPDYVISDDDSDDEQNAIEIEMINEPDNVLNVNEPDNVLNVNEPDNVLNVNEPDNLPNDSDTDEPVDNIENEQNNNPIERRQRNIHLIRGRNKKTPYIWTMKEPERRGRVAERNLVTHLPGPRGAARDVRAPEDAWNLLFDDIMIEEITLRTNEEIHRQVQNISMQSYHRNTSTKEMKAYIGILYLAGVHKDSRRNLEELWSPQFGFSIYRATMSLPRFRFISTCLRFDDKTNRQERARNDRLAAIRYLWDNFVEHCSTYYTPFEYCTIDEQLLGFRGRCGFRVYIKSKPDRYGLKIVMLNDSKTSYMCNAIPYIGEVNTQNKEPVPTYYVRKLSEPIHGTNRNVTTDNWFTSVPLFNRMLLDYKLTMVGTMRANKTEIPAKFLEPKPAGESLFAFDHNKTLVSYSPKLKKNVILLSTLHRSANVDVDTKKPEIVLFYNSTKGGTDTFDKLCHGYSVCRRTKRWPLRFFFGILDQCGVNSMILYLFNEENPKINRRKYLETLAMNLIKPWLYERIETPTIRRGIKLSIQEILQISPERQAANDDEPPRKQRCSFCPRVKDRKTKLRCSSCRAPMCEEHRAMVCTECTI